MTDHATSEFVYRSAWKRRLILTLLGFVLIVLAKALYVWLCWGEWKPPFAEPRNSIAYLGVLKPPVTSATLARIPGFPPDKRDKALLLVPDQAQECFSMVYDDPKDPGRGGGIENRPMIPRELLDFTPSVVISAFKRTKVDDILVNNFAEGCSARDFKTSSTGEFLALELWKDNAFAPSSKAVTLFTQRNGRLETLFASTQPVMQWMAGPSNNPQMMLVLYSNGVQGYRWSNQGVIPDPSVKSQNFRDLIALCLLGMKNEANAGGTFLIPVILLLWLYRLIKFLLLLIFRWNYRPFNFLRGITLGCALPLGAFMSLFLVPFSTEYCGSLLSCGFVDLLGWIAILLAAALPNRRVASQPAPQTPEPPVEAP